MLAIFPQDMDMVRRLYGWERKRVFFFFLIECIRVWGLTNAWRFEMLR